MHAFAEEVEICLKDDTLNKVLNQKMLTEQSSWSSPLLGDETGSLLSVTILKTVH